MVEQQHLMGLWLFSEQRSHGCNEKQVQLVQSNLLWFCPLICCLESSVLPPVECDKTEEAIRNNNSSSALQPSQADGC